MRFFQKKSNRSQALGQAGLFQTIWIQGFQIFWHELAVLADQHVIEPNFAPAVLGPLDQHHVPVYRRAVSVVALLVRLARCEVQRASNFLVEQYIAHRLSDVRVKAQRKFTDVARTRIGVQNLIEPLGIACRGIDDFTVFKLEPDILEPCSGVESGSVVLQHAVHRLFHRAGEYLAVRDVPITGAPYRAKPSDAE